MNRPEAVQGLGVTFLVVALAWLLGPWFLLTAGALLVFVPEFLATRKRKGDESS